MFKAKIAADAYDKLSDEAKKLYKKVGDDYVIDAEGVETEDAIGEMKRAKQREVAARKEAETKLKELETKLESLDTDDAKKRGDIATLEKSWKDKLDATSTELTNKLSAKDEFIRKTLIDSKAAELANEISTTPSLLLPHVRGRFNVDFEGDNPELRILDKDGKNSALTVDDLKKEFIDNKDYSAIIKGNLASGGGAPQADKESSSGGAQPNNQKNDSKLLSQYSSQELAAHITAKNQQEG